MLLSEAIRLGSMLGPQIRGYYVTENGGSCALGAAIKALNLKPQFGYAELRRVFPHLRQALVEAMSKPERDHSASHPAYFAYRLIKQENIFAFYTARAGMIEALDYKGNSYNLQFPPCTHLEHHVV